MKDNRYIIRQLLIISIVAIFFSSCNKDDLSELQDYNYFISSEEVASYSVATMTNMLAVVSAYYPEIASMEPYIEDNVDVYKMVYKTTIFEDEIEASGLVCIPATPGEYPVLSFQNGTNTLNSEAPSEYPEGIYYQLIEYIASMGFIVVIPDYPGFGSSEQIPHPYLIKEPTVQSIVDMFHAINEIDSIVFPGLTIKNEYYLLGYSQGGWATLALHKALDTDYQADFNLAGSACGAGPYNLYNLLTEMTGNTTYSMPSYIAYIINAYSHYDQFTNSVSDILNGTYASKLSSLYTGTLSLDEINDELTTSIPGLFKSEFLAGFASSPSYSTVRQALINNSISPWITLKPLFFGHGTGDTHVSVTSTESMYDDMIAAGTSAAICQKVLYPDLDHGEAQFPCIIDGIQFLLELRDN
jgi:pimeloyl-ACP methyl ester carboxylesterase